MNDCGFFSNRVLPSVYSDEISYYEQLNKLCMELNQLIERFNNQHEAYVTIQMLQDSQDEQDKRWAEGLLVTYDRIMDFTKGEIRRLEELIANAIAGKVTIFDPTYGISPRPVEQVVRNVYHWLRYYADYALTIDNLTLTAQVRDDYQITAKNFDLYSMLYYSHNEKPAPIA